MLGTLEQIRPSDLQKVKKLGGGGFGNVFLCKWHGCPVAVKYFNQQFIADVASVEVSFLQEVSTLATLHHPNVVTVYGVTDVTDADASLSSRAPAMVTEYCNGGSLRDNLTARSPFVRKTKDRIKIALQAAIGMKYLHSRNKVHLDLKSDNLLLCSGGVSRCKVADFGLTREKKNSFISGKLEWVGTLPYMAPEVLSSSQVNEKADVYSFGVVMFELATFSRPYADVLEAPNGYNVLMTQRLTKKVKLSLAEELEPVPGFKELMESCLRDDPEERPGFDVVVEMLQMMVAAPAAGT